MTDIALLKVTESKTLPKLKLSVSPTIDKEI